jgi:hypothetical protein
VCPTSRAGRAHPRSTRCAGRGATATGSIHSSVRFAAVAMKSCVDVLIAVLALVSALGKV